MGWKDKVEALKPSKTEVKIGDKTFMVYQISGGLIFEAQDVLIPLFNSMGHFFGSTKNDIGYQHHSEVDPAGKVIEDQTSLAISPELAKLRATQRDMAVANLVTGILSPKTKVLVERVIMDALPDIWPRADANPAEPKPKEGEILAYIGMESTIELLKAIWKVNEKLLHPLMAAIEPGLDNVKAKMKGAVVAAASGQQQTPLSPTTEIDLKAGTASSQSPAPTPPVSVTSPTASGQPPEA